MSRQTWSILFAVLLLPALGLAQTNVAAQNPPGPAKIVYINLEQALFTTDEGKAQVAEAQKFVDEKQKQMDKMRDELNKLRQQLDVQGSKLTEDALADLQDQYDSKNTAIQRFQQDTEKEIEARKNRMGSALAKKMQPVIEALAKERGISAIEVLNQARDFYVDPSLVYTDELVKAYNQKYPVGAPKTPAAPAPATPAPKK